MAGLRIFAFQNVISTHVAQFFSKPSAQVSEIVLAHNSLPWTLRTAKRTFCTSLRCSSSSFPSVTGASATKVFCQEISCGVRSCNRNLFVRWSRLYSQIPQQELKPLDKNRKARHQKLMLLTYLSGFIGVCLLGAIGAQQYKRMARKAKGIEDLKIREYGRRPYLFRYRGFIFPQFVVDDVKSIHQFEIREDDLWIVSYPKAGTTWLQELVYLIDTNLDFEGAEKNTMDDRFPFFEFPYPGKKAINDLPSPRRIKTHLPFPLLPNQMKEKKPKIIYIARNPKDTLVSLYHFAVKFFAPVQRFQGTYDQFCELFAEDKAIYGPWWKHVLEAWKCRDDDNVLVLFYEDLQKDLPGVVRQVASFLGKSLTDAEVDAVAKHCTFESMKNNKSVNYDWLKEQGMASDKADFMRKGKVGDWKNHLSSEISAKLEEMVSSKLTPAGVVFQDTLEGSYGQDEDDML